MYRHRRGTASSLLLAFMLVFWLHLPCLAQPQGQTGCCSQTALSQGDSLCCDDYLALWHYDQAPFLAVSLALERLLPSPPKVLLETAAESPPVQHAPPSLAPSSPRGPPSTAA